MFECLSSTRKAYLTTVTFRLLNLQTFLYYFMAFARFQWVQHLLNTHLFVCLFACFERYCGRNNNSSLSIVWCCCVEGLPATRQDWYVHGSFVKEHTVAFVGPSVGELMACCVSPHSAQSLVFKWHLSAFWCLALCSPAIRKDTLRVPDRCLVTSVRSCFSSTRTGGPHTFLLWNIIIKMDSTLWGLSLAVIKTYKSKK